MLSFSVRHCYSSNSTLHLLSKTNKPILLLQLLQISVLWNTWEITWAAVSKLHNFFLYCQEKGLISRYFIGIFCTFRLPGILQQSHVAVCSCEPVKNTREKQHWLSGTYICKLVISIDTNLKKISRSLLLFTCQLFQILEGFTFRSSNFLRWSYSEKILFLPCTEFTLHSTESQPVIQ